MKKGFCLLFSVFLIGSVRASELCEDRQETGTFKTLAGELRRDGDIELFLRDLMKTSHIRTLSVAVVQEDIVEKLIGDVYSPFSWMRY